MELHRRTWLAALGAGTVSALTTRGAKADEAGCPASDGPLRLQDFRPKSMLHVAETRVATPRFPVIDVHTHFSFAKGGRQGAASDDSVAFTTTAEDALAVMDRKGVRAVVNLTGGFGKGLEQAIGRFDQAHPGRFYTCTEPMWGAWADPRFPQLQADAIEKAARAGAKGLKVLKTLGLFLRERGREGPLVKVDDRRFDPMWEACAAHRLPVYIHVSDPEAFFLPIDCTNERWDELGHHPDWSFHGKDFPSHRELMDARDRVFARHPKTLFVGLHVGHDAENLGFVSESLDRFPNLTVELGARIGELGRQPRRSRKFFETYQDRIFFGTDAVPPPEGERTPQQVFKDELYEIYYRFLETEDEYFDYAPAPVPPQGRWRIYGIGLPDAILKKVYHENAERLLGLSR
ncbi:MAG TPA: amidohydrolase family protein [Vicinamibacteria bacterium]|nr:amidohydrolase family protein [Vicinamibacteria bacterium]